MQLAVKVFGNLVGHDLRNLLCVVLKSLKQLIHAGIERCRWPDVALDVKNGVHHFLVVLNKDITVMAQHTSSLFGVSQLLKIVIRSTIV